MKKIIFIILSSILLGVGIGWLVFHSSSTQHVGERKIKYYRDPMNPQITSPIPKKSSDGMDFVPVYEEESSGERKIAYYKDPMHPWYTSDKPGKAPDCGMDLVPVYEGESDIKGIKIDPVVVQNIGVKTEPVQRRTLTRTVRTVGKIEIDERKVYTISTKVMGWVEKLYVDYTGKSVRKGEPLMELYSPDLVSTQEEYLQALRYHSQMQQSNIEEARKGADVLVQSAKRRLLNWDISEHEIAELAERGTPKKTMTFYSPADGIVMDKMVSQGKALMPGMDLYKIADISTVWVIADIYQYELPWIKLGQKAEIELSYLPGKTYNGTVTYIYPILNMETKTVKVRIEVRNTPTFDLKPEMFATVKITTHPRQNVVAVPEQAVIRSGERNIVIVALGGGYFEPRDVKLGVTDDHYVEILAGIHEGETIVTSSQFLIDSESNLKAAISQMLAHEEHDMPNPMKSETKPEIPKQKNTPKPKPLPTHPPTQSMIDPVCGMETSGDESLSYTYNGVKYYFCSSEDMEKFKNDPEKYVSHDHTKH